MSIIENRNNILWPTSCIVHLADSANFKGVTSNKQCSGSTGLCFESPNDTIHVTVTAKCKRPKRTLKPDCEN